MRDVSAQGYRTKWDENMNTVQAIFASLTPSAAGTSPDLEGLPLSDGDASPLAAFSDLLAAQQTPDAPVEGISFDHLSAQALARLAGDEAELPSPQDELVQSSDLLKADGGEGGQPLPLIGQPLPQSSTVLPPQLSSFGAVAEAIRSQRPVAQNIEAQVVDAASISPSTPVSPSPGALQTKPQIHSVAIAADPAAQHAAASMASAPIVNAPVTPRIASAPPAIEVASVDAGADSLEFADLTRQLTIRPAPPADRAAVQFTISQNPIDDPAWSQAVASRIQWMGSTGTQTAQLQLNPEELGGIHVQLSMQGDKASVQFQAQHSETSELIERLMPRLSQAMEQQGMRLEEVKVSHQSAWADAQQQQQSQQFSDRAQRGVVHFSGDAEPASEPEASREDSAPKGSSRGDSAVDDYA
ncbi:MAG: hypothetical protein CMN80_05975 [Spongiibacter sp.]|nr:hypothetical protein [Spongiibacter sp.]